MILEFNADGVPLIGHGRTKDDAPFLLVTKGKPENPVAKHIEETEDKIDIDGTEIAAWGENNDFPNQANNIIGGMGVLNTGLKFIRNFTLGQGIFPCRVVGYDENGNEKLEVIDDIELINFCNGRLVRRYLEKLGRDYLKFGVGFVQLMLNDASAGKMVSINTINAMHSRLSVAKNGRIEDLYVSGKWPDTPSSGDYDKFTVLSEHDPLLDLRVAKTTNSKATSFIYVVRDSWSNAEYYSEPVWLSAHKAGWTDIAKVVPKFLLKLYENQITFKYHVRIPYAFWDKMFPKTEYPDVKTRKAAIDEYMDGVDLNLSSAENAGKSLFSFYEINQSGRAEEKWEIDTIDNKTKSGEENLITSAAANSEILFALMLNPNVLGAGMPGGTYAGNQGGSNIREAFLVNIANSWIDRQNWLDPLEAYLYYNGQSEDVQLRFRSTILTTLDTGAGTLKKLS